MPLFHRNKQRKDTRATTPNSPGRLSGENTVAEWLDHPIGGAILRDMLRKAGQNENVLHIVRRMSMNRLISLSKGQFTQAMLDDMVRQVNAGHAPTETGQEHTPAKEPADDTVTLPDWHEKVTPDRFAGKTVIVTGAGSGIGRATASRVAREGGHVIAVDISKERLAELANELSETKIETVVGDITSDKSIAKIISITGKKIDGLANVAGIMDNFTPLHEMTDGVWDRVLSVNLLGMMKLSRAVIPHMLEQHSGSIVNVGSEASLKASAAGAAYTTSKHAVVGLSKSMAFMYGPGGIRTNVIAPGAVLTNIEAKYESGLGETRVNTILATAPEAAEAPVLAAAITYLLSDDSTNINGVVLPSDGGWSVQ